MIDDAKWPNQKALLNLSVHRLWIELEALKTTRLPGYPPELAAIIRGALQVATTQLFCKGRSKRPGKQCSNCHCMHGTWIQVQMPPDHHHARKFQNPPVPLLIRAFPERLHYKPGDSLHFSITLIGVPLDTHLSDLILAIQHLAFQGLGQEVGSFCLRSIVASPLENKQPEYSLFPRLDLSVPHQNFFTKGMHYDRDKLTLKFETLTVLLSKGNSILIPEFKVLASRLFARIKLLSQLYAEAELEVPDWKEELLEGVKTIPVSLKAGVWEKKNMNRSEGHALGRKSIVGFTGKVIYSGKHLDLFWPYLRLGQFLHIGKLTSFGLGSYSIVQDN